jgi:hypothetical protein
LPQEQVFFAAFLTVFLTVFFAVFLTAFFTAFVIVAFFGQKLVCSAARCRG